MQGQRRLLLTHPTSCGTGCCKPDWSRDSTNRRIRPGAAQTGVDQTHLEAALTSVEQPSPEASQAGVDQTRPETAQTDVDQRHPEETQAGVDQTRPEAARIDVDQTRPKAEQLCPEVAQAV